MTLENKIYDFISKSNEFLVEGPIDDFIDGSVSYLAYDSILSQIFDPGFISIKSAVKNKLYQYKF